MSLSLKEIRESFVAFGDSHSQCFKPFIQKTHSFPASSAKGLGNTSSLSGTGEKIRVICKEKLYKGYIFYFGKVDIDFILTHVLNTKPDTDFKGYLDTIANNYIAFIKSLCIENVYICELTINHLSDSTLLTINNNQQHHINLNKNLDLKYTSVKYTTVLPYKIRNTYVEHFNSLLEKACIENSYTFLKVNNLFKTESGEYKIPSEYLRSDPIDHHLVDAVLGKSYLKNLVHSSELDKREEPPTPIYSKRTPNYYIHSIHVHPIWGPRR